MSIHTPINDTSREYNKISDIQQRALKYCSSSTVRVGERFERISHLHGIISEANSEFVSRYSEEMKGLKIHSIIIVLYSRICIRNVNILYLNSQNLRDLLIGKTFIIIKTMLRQ